MDALDLRVLVSTDDSTYVVVQGINSESMSDGRESVDVGAWPDDTDHKRKGPRDSGGGLDGLYYPGDTNGQKVYRDAIMNKSTDVYTMILRDGADGFKQQTLVASFGVSVSRAGVAEVSIGLEGFSGRADASATPTIPPLTDAQDGLDARLLKSGTPTAFSNEACSDSGDGLTWVIDDSAKAVWERLGTITVEVSTDGGSTWAANTANTLNRLFGAVTFDADQTGNLVRVSGNYLPMASVAEAHEYSWEVSRTITQKGRFTDDHNRKGYGPLQFSASANMFFDATADFQADVEDPESIYVLEFQQEQAVDMRAWVIITDDTEDAERSATINEATSFEPAADAERRTLSFGPTA